MRNVGFPGLAASPRVSMFYVSDQRDLSAEILTALDAGGPLPPSTFYQVPGGAESWLNLTNAAGYASRGDSHSLFAEHAPNIGAEIALAADLDGGEHTVAFVSLGPGDAEKDQRLLAALIAEERWVPGSAYVAVDASAQFALQAAERMALDRDMQVGINIIGVVGEFSDALARLGGLDDRGVTVWALLGNTMSNFRHELSFLELLGKSARPNDVFCLEVTLSAPSSDEVASLGELDANRRFNLGPLAYVGAACDSSKMKYAVVEDTSDVPGTVTIAGRYHGLTVHGRDFGVPYITLTRRYRLAPLVEFLAEAGWTLTTRPWIGAAGRSCLLMLARGGSHAATAS